MGKTQLVLDYVQHYSKQYKGAFWIEAGRKQSFERDWINLYQTLYSMHTMPTLVGTEPVSLEKAVLGIKSWFSGRQGPWLMVFDGADNLEDKDAADFIDIRHFIPDVPSLHIIIATRSGTVKDITQLDGVHVSELEETQAVELFYRYSKLQRNDLSIAAEVKKIVKELGCLALAVTLAGAYVGSSRRVQSNITAYIPEYNRRRRELLSQKADRLVHQYGEAVLTTWETSYFAVQQQCPVAAIMLTLLSFLHYEDIFPQLLGEAEIVTDGAGTGQSTSVIFSNQAVGMNQMDSPLGILEKYSFVKWNDRKLSYTIHKLVHAWGYERLSPDEKKRYSDGVLRFIVNVQGRCGPTPAERLRLVPHIMANFATLAAAKKDLSYESVERVDEVAKLGFFLNGLGLWLETRTLNEFVVDTRQRILGKDHLDTISAMDELANTLHQQGQLENAAQTQKEVLKKRRRILGKDHPDTISAMGDFATILYKQGQLENAARMENEVLEKSRRILGENHHITIAAMMNLGMMLYEQGQLENAARMENEALEKSRRILGKDHPDTILAVGNLATILREQGQLENAARMEYEVLEKFRRIRGKDHPDTILAMGNLATTLRKKGDLNEALQILRELVEKLRSIFGDDHPRTLVATYKLVITLNALGLTDEALRKRLEVLEQGNGTLGDDHPDTRLALIELARTLYEECELEVTLAPMEDAWNPSSTLRDKHPLTTRADHDADILLPAEKTLQK